MAIKLTNNLKAGTITLRFEDEITQLGTFAWLGSRLPPGLLEQPAIRGLSEPVLPTSITTKHGTLELSKSSPQPVNNRYTQFLGKLDGQSEAAKLIGILIAANGQPVGLEAMQSAAKSGLRGPMKTISTLAKQHKLMFADLIEKFTCGGEACYGASVELVGAAKHKRIGEDYIGPTALNGRTLSKGRGRPTEEAVKKAKAKRAKKPRLAKGTT